MRDAGLGVAVVADDDPVGFAERQGLEEDGVDDGEDRDIGAEAEGEDQQHGGREALLTGKAGDGLADITQERFDEGHHRENPRGGE